MLRNLDFSGCSCSSTRLEIKVKQTYELTSHLTGLPVTCLLKPSGFRCVVGLQMYSVKVSNGSARVAYAALAVGAICNLPAPLRSLETTMLFA